VGLTLAAHLALLGGCLAESGDGGIFVLKNVLAADKCVLTPSESEPGIAHGRLDLLLPSSYIFIAQMKSRITALTGQEDQRTIITSGAKIDIAFPGSQFFNDTELADLRTAGLTHFKQLFTAPLAPNGGLTDAGFDLVPLELVRRIVAKATLTTLFRLEAVATFTIEGDMSGLTVTSQPFVFPITMGNNLSVNVAGTCPLPMDFGAPRTGYSCNPAQDGVVDCCTTGGFLRCPANVSTM
jgi:hypothetical protein